MSISETHYHVTYSEMYFDRNGDKDFIDRDHWCTPSVLSELKQNTRIGDLTILETKIVDNYYLN